MLIIFLIKNFFNSDLSDSIHQFLRAVVDITMMLEKGDLLEGRKLASRYQ